MDQQDGSTPAPVPEDAREATEAQRVEEDQLEHQDGEPDAPGSQQSHEQIPGESTR